MKTLDPIHPGEILLEEFLEPMEISQSRYDLEMEKDKLGNQLDSEVHTRSAA